MYLVSVCFQVVQVTALGRSLVQRRPTEYDVSKCDRETRIVRRTWPTRGRCLSVHTSNKKNSMQSMDVCVCLPLSGVIEKGL
jgi:hypothetical protein